jgi:hypothetical protein
LLVDCAEIFPALQRDGDVSVFPDEIVEGAEVEFFALLQAHFGEKLCDLEFTDLIDARAAILLCAAEFNIRRHV